MKSLCCDCLLPDQQESTFTTWNDRKKTQTFQKNQSLTNFTTSSSFVKITSNRNRYKKQKNKQLLSNSVLTMENPPSNRKRTTSAILPSVQISQQQKLKQERIRTLEIQNQHYIEIIQNQLTPLKRDYEHLKNLYKNKLVLVEMMNFKLQEIQKMNYMWEKSSMCTQPTSSMSRTPRM